jgi:HTH-type transcriptional regulator/antitoxin HigA
MPESTDNFSVDALLDGLFPREGLLELFNRRIKDLDISPTHALEILDMEYRALQGIINGSSSRVDTINFIKLASFLKLPKDEVIKLYFKALGKNYPDTASYPKEKVDFINSNFDLAILKRAGFITNITNYVNIENSLKSHFGMKSIFEYKLPSKGIAFSAGARKPKEILTRGFWINSAKDAFEEIANPHNYDRDALISYFPKIRWRSTNVEEGLTSVIADLFRLGITVFYQSSLPTLQLKGATIVVNDKPCIVLTDHAGFYSTLWHTLCHELSHVLFDLDEIDKNFHISGEGLDDPAVAKKEIEADTFAREYLFSKDKSKKVKAHIDNKKFIEGYADELNIHKSFIYTYHAFDNGKTDERAWSRAKKNNPSFEIFIEKISNPWTDSKSPAEHIQILKEDKIYD